MTKLYDINFLNFIINTPYDHTDNDTDNELLEALNTGKEINLDAFENDNFNTNQSHYLINFRSDNLTYNSTDHYNISSNNNNNNKLKKYVNTFKPILNTITEEKDEDFRLVYLPKKTIYIYDWDDTLLASKFIRNNNNNMDNYTKKISILENIILTLLQSSINNGIVFIITNASYRWFYLTCYKYYPKVFEILENIKIISARDKYSVLTPNSFLWKKLAFDYALGCIISDVKVIKNIICIGDSYDEHLAIRETTQNHCHIILKQIKLKNNPNIDELLSQLKFLISNIYYIYDNEDDIQMKIGK